MSALDTQVAGSHYKDMAIQPAEFIHKNKIGFLPGCVIKRMCRWEKKDGIQDLRKAIHEIQLMIEMESDCRPTSADFQDEKIKLAIADELNEMADWFSNNSYADVVMTLRKRANGYVEMKK